MSADDSAFGKFALAQLEDAATGAFQRAQAQDVVRVPIVADRTRAQGQFVCVQ